MKQFIRIIPLFLLYSTLQCMSKSLYDSTKAPRAFVENIVHAGPTMTAAELIRFAQKNEVVLSPDTFAFQETYRYKNFNIFQKGYDSIFSVLKTDDDMAQVLLDYARRSAQEGRKYLEFMVCPSRIEQSIPTADWKNVLKKINVAAKKAEEEWGIIVTPLLTLLRGDSQEKCEEYTHFLLENSKEDLNCFGGLQLAGDEARFPDVSDYMNSYYMVYKAGLGCAAHAGENAGPENILAALRLLGVSRISQGISCVTSQECIDRLKEKNILVEVALSSNVCMQVQNIGTYQNHPLPAILAAQVACHFTNSDNPILCDTTAGNEGRIVQENFNLPLKAFMKSDIDAMEHAFLPPSRQHHRAEIIAAIQAYYSQEIKAAAELEQERHKKSESLFSSWTEKLSNLLSNSSNEGNS